MQAKIVGFGFAKQEAEAWYVPCNGKLGKEKVLKLLSPLLETKSIGWIGHNIKYDLHVLANEGLSISHIAFDTMIASYLLSPQNPRHNLDDLSLEKFGKRKIPIDSLIGKGKNQISMQDVPIEKVGEYCCEDADYTFRLYTLFSRGLKEEHLEKVLQEIELPLIPVLIGMERQGIRVDVELLKQLSTKFRAQLEKLQEEIFAIAGEEFNLNSPKQLSMILFEKLGIKPPKKTMTGFSTSADVLESIKDESPIIEKILQYRMLEKLRSTYTDALLEDVLPHDPHIHCTFNQSVAATGRLSCQDPESTKHSSSFQRRKIDPSSFYTFKVQLSHAFRRLFANRTASSRPFQRRSRLDQSLQTRRRHPYLHRIARLRFADRKSHPRNATTSESRQLRHPLWTGPYGLSQQIGVSHKEAAQIIETYFARYRHVKEFLESCRESARKTGYAITLMGRKRPIPDIHSKNPMIRAAAERLAVNTPLQGTDADLIKLAMIELDRRLKKHPDLGHILLQIHDELVLEGPEDESEKLGKLLRAAWRKCFLSRCLLSSIFPLAKTGENVKIKENCCHRRPCIR